MEPQMQPRAGTMDPREYIKVGYLVKQGHFVRNWKRRFFVLTENELSYYADDSLKKKRGMINLATLGTVMIRDDPDIQFLFELTTPTESYLIQTVNRSESKTVQRILYSRVNFNETQECIRQEFHPLSPAINGYYNRLVTNLCESSTPNSLFDALLCLTAFYSRMYSLHSKNFDYEATRTRCDNILDVMKKKYEQSVRSHIWNPDIDQTHKDLVQIVTKLKQKIESVALPMTDPLYESKKGFHDSYTLISQLGSGSYSVVHEAVNKRTGVHFAVKYIQKKDMSSNEKDALLNEVNILSQLNHPNIVKIEEFYDEKESYYLVCELLNGGELFSRIVEKKFYSENEARNSVRIIIGAVAYLHSKNIAHRDLKPENILLSSSGDLKIADFGFAKSTSVKGRLQTDCGSPWYVAPEILEGKFYGTEVDMWSIGVILYIMLCGFPPFHDNNQARLFRRIRSCTYAFLRPFWDRISKEVKDLIKHLLVLDPRERYDAQQCLSHPWLKAESATPSQDVSLADAREGIRSFKDFGRKHVLKQGYLTKQGHILPTWKKRSFELTAEHLSYYEVRSLIALTHRKDESSPIPKGSIPLGTILQIKDGRKPEYFTLCTAKKDYPIIAHSVRDKELWKEAILAARRCWKLWEHSKQAFDEKRVRDAAEMVGEARRSEGMILNQSLVQLWGTIGKSCSLDSCTAIWFMKAHQITTEEQIVCLATRYQDNGQYALGYSNGTIVVMDYEGSRLISQNLCPDAITAICFTTTGLLVGTDKGLVKKYESYTTTKVNTFAKGISKLLYDAQRNHVFVLFVDGFFSVWDCISASIISENTIGNPPIGAAYSENYQFLLAADQSTLTVFDTPSYNLVIKIECPRIDCFVALPSNSVVVGCDEGSVRVYSLPDGVLQHEMTDSIPTHAGAYASFALSSDYEWLVGYKASGVLILWSLKTFSREIAVTREGKCFGMIVTPNNSVLLIATDHSVERWILDWTLTVDGRLYTPPVWMLMENEEQRPDPSSNLSSLAPATPPAQIALPPLPTPSP